MDLLGIGQANCFRTHNELTMGLLGKYPLAPSDREITLQFCHKGDTHVICDHFTHIKAYVMLSLMGHVTLCQTWPSAGFNRDV